MRKNPELKFSNSFKTTCVQFSIFAIVGFTNTVIGYAVYAISLFFFRKFGIFCEYDIYVAQVVMFLLSVLWAFYWNNRIVFNQDKNKTSNWLKALFKTYISYAFTSLFLSEILLALWVKVLGINEFFAPIINLAITVPLNFLLQKYWTFS